MRRSRLGPPGVAIVNVSPNSDFLNLRYLPAPFGALGGGPKYEGGRGASWIMIVCTTTVGSTIVIFSVCLPGMLTVWAKCITRTMRKNPFLSIQVPRGREPVR